MAKQSTSEDEFQRKYVEALNSLSLFIYGLKNLELGSHLMSNIYDIVYFMPLAFEMWWIEYVGASVA